MNGIELMANPEEWPNRPVLPLVNPGRKIDETGRPSVGVLAEAALGRFVWYEGVSVGSTASVTENNKYLDSAKVYLAPQLQDLIDEGWEVE